MILKNNLLNSKSIANKYQQTDVIAQAFLALWNEDRRFATDFLMESIKSDLKSYESLLEKESEEKSEEKEELAYSINTKIKALAKKEVAAADSLMKEFIRMKSNEILSQQDLNQRMKIAMEGFDPENPQHLLLMTQIIEIGIPDIFPKFIVDLSLKKPDVANQIVQQAIRNLSSRNSYKLRHAILISTLVFKENMLLIPVLEENSDEFFVLTTPLADAPKLRNSDNPETFRNLITNFLSSCIRFFQNKLQDSVNTGFNERNEVFQAYFLLKKIQAYSNTLNLPQDAWAGIETQLSLQCQQANLSSQILSDVKAYAERLAFSNNPLAIDDGTTSLKKAEEATDPRQKIIHLIDAVVLMIQRRKFDEAEKKISEIPIEELRKPLKNFLNLQLSLVYLDEKNWLDFEKQVSQIDDETVKTYLYLKAIEKNPKEIRYSLELRKSIEKIDNPTTKTAAYFTLVSTLLKLKHKDFDTVFFDALKALNQTPDYEEQPFGVEIKIIPLERIIFASYFQENAFRDTFANLAKRNWEIAKVRSSDIKAQGLRAIAEVTAASAMLEQ